MHSRIFQLERSLEDINNYSLEEYQFYCDCKHSWFIGYIADYVDEDTNRNEDIEWFLECYHDFNEYFKANNKIEESITFSPNFKKAYFNGRFERLKQQINSITIDEFTNSLKAYTLKELIENRFDFYIYSRDKLQTMDDFVRDLPDKEITYYFGNTLDYHC